MLLVWISTVDGVTGVMSALALPCAVVLRHALWFQPTHSILLQIGVQPLLVCNVKALLSATLSGWVLWCCVLLGMLCCQRLGPGRLLAPYT